MTDDRKPIVSPVAALLRSRKTIVALATALTSIVVFMTPSLAPIQGELVTILTVLGTVLITSIAWEDSATKRGPTTVTTGSAETVNVNQQPPDAAPVEDDTRAMLPVEEDEPPHHW